MSGVSQSLVGRYCLGCGEFVTWQPATRGPRRCPDCLRAHTQERKHRNYLADKAAGRTVDSTIVASRRYGIAPEAVMALRAKARCDACGETSGPFHIDHDHASGRVRGLLCQKCNILAGWLENSPDRLGQVQNYLGGN